MTCLTFLAFFQAKPFFLKLAVNFVRKQTPTFAKNSG